LYGFYSILRYLVSDRGPSLGMANAITIIDLERGLGFYHETGVQAATLPHEWLIQFANWYYVLGFLPMLVGSAVLAAWKAPAALNHWRGIFALSLVIAVIGYTFFPLTPPRLLPPEWGFVDTLTTYGPQYYGDHSGASLFNAYGRLPSMVNVYAAMPSMHVAWSVIASALIFASLPNRIWARVVAISHPLIMGVAVIITANHFLLDVVAGLAVLGLAVTCVRAYDHCFGEVQDRERYSGSFPPAASGA
jgi:PAP2 superfamily